ncbi:MAG: hypothetical protein RLZ25_1894 [Pseudomonadota bacterium]
MGVLLALMEVNIRGRINKKMRVIADSKAQAAEKAKIMLLNDLDVDLNDFELEVQLIEGEFQDDSEPLGI